MGDKSKMQKAKKAKGKSMYLRLDSITYEKLQAACAIQQHKEGQLARLLIQCALPLYEQARSIEALQKLAESGVFSKSVAGHLGEERDRSMDLLRKTGVAVAV